MSNGTDTHTMDDICKIKCHLIEFIEEYLLQEDLSDIDTDEAGKIIDMIKDLAATERYHAQTCYYRTVVDAMHENSEEAMSYISEYSEAPHKSITDPIETVKVIWTDADPALRTKIKQELTALLAEA